ncbi:MAG: fluoride efflux transporter CrcB [Acidobacteriaceae bacterium]|nr:fluoride efflux transporter CrcB [Acidobacteriaceae bacterium]MBV8572803.1 fluoride efflux transporter CrcB [Acidobacteriaceae bacterium]
MLQNILLISLGAIAGANLRYFVAQLVSRLIPSNFPYGTLVINFSASFILGLFLIWTGERVIVDPRWRLLIAVGFCGGYSTYSSFAFETFALMEQGRWMLFASNIILMNVLCLMGVALGAAAARSI